MLIATPVSATTPALWDHPGYDAERSYFNPHESAITRSTVGHLRRAWTKDLRNVEETCAYFVAPVLGAGRLFAADRDGIAAYNPGTGAVAWRFDWESGDDGTPRLAVADDTLVMAKNDCYSVSDPNGWITAIDMTGHVRWRKQMPYGIASVVVDKSTVLVSCVDVSGDAVVTAYRVRDGKVLWSKPKFSSGGVSANGLVPLHTFDPEGSARKQTIAVDITTGRARWTRPLIVEMLSASPSSDRFYGTDAAGALTALDAATGATRWSVPAAGTPSLATDGPRVYLADGHKISALAAATGRKVWSRNLTGDVAQPVLAGGLLYTGGPVLNATTGAPAGPSFPDHTIVTGGRLYQVDGPHLTAFKP